MQVTGSLKLDGAGEDTEVRVEYNIYSSDDDTNHEKLGPLKAFEYQLMNRMYQAGWNLDAVTSSKSFNRYWWTKENN